MKISHALLCMGMMVLAITCLCSPAFAVWSCGFESGLGHNNETIGTTAGIDFGTTNGGGLRYADINSGCYRATSDNGKVNEDGEYFISGDVAAMAANPWERAKISFLNGTASFFSLGYSSQYEFFLEAYDMSGNLLATDSGPSWTKSQGANGLRYLTVSHTGIAYVMAHDDGGSWMIDNITTDAPVPEPSSLITLSAAGVLLLRTRRRR